MTAPARPPLARASEPFRCEVDPRREAIHVRAVGELDATTVPLFDAQLRELRIAGFQRLVLDVTRVVFVDPSGLRLLESWDAAAHADGFELDVVAAAPAAHARFDVRRLAG